MKIIKTKVNFRDARGEIRDILTHVQVDSVTYLSCKKGAIRGNHFHKKTIQYTYVLSGEMESYTAKGEKGKVQKKKVKAGDLTIHAVNECHAFKALKDSEILSLALGPRKGNDYEDDTYRMKKPMVS